MILKVDKLTLNDLRDLCQSCGLDTHGNKEELGDRLSTLFCERNNVSPAPGYNNLNENDGVLEITEDSGPAFSDPGVMRCDSGKTLDMSDIGSETELPPGNGPKLGESVGNNTGFPSSFKGKGKTRDVTKNENPVPQDSNEFCSIREEIESRAVMLRLANDKGWKVALQVVGCNDKMMQKYKDQIGTATRMWVSQTNLWRYTKRSNKKTKRKYTDSSSSESEDRGFKSQSSSDLVTCYNCGGVGHISPNCPRLMQKNCHLDQDPNKTIDYTQVQKQEMTMLQKSVVESVVGKIHTSVALNYWRIKIKPSPIILDWLENGVPLWPRGVLPLAISPDPKQYPLTTEQSDWINHSWVDIHIDNRVALSMVTKGGKLPWQKEVLRELWELLDKHDIWINETFWVPSLENPADNLTRVLDPSDWKLSQRVFTILEKKWGPHTIDPYSSRGFHSNCHHSKVALRRMVADINAPSNRLHGHASTLDNLRKRGFRAGRTIKKPEMAIHGSQNKLVAALLEKAHCLIRKACSKNWNIRLDRAWKTFVNFCKITGQNAFPSSEKTLLSCLIWLDLTDAISNCSDILAAVSREHLESSLPDPSKTYNVRKAYKALMKESRKEHEPEWPRDPLPIFALHQFVTNKPLYMDETMWIRDATLIAIGLRTMRRPSELCKMKLNDIRL
ncbi:2945_t:CDS:2, partial [Cetraspora pellucida]